MSITLDWPTAAVQMTDSFPNIKALGLRTSPMYVLSGTNMKPEDGPHIVMAADLEALLAKAQRVYGFHGDMPNSEKKEFWAEPERMRLANETGKQALLIGIAPIAKPDTAEGLLRELLAHIHGQYGIVEQSKIIDRTKRLLGEK